ncbi:MAG: hypothetical protein DHS20C09_20620 [marine bacterium B5-7]|nr:MAG: hypothetical protein DHS20C09_20620 [marine bacterium B5-7]
MSANGIRSTTPKFSIVTISFNQARFLEKAICSVIEQDYNNLEYIVVDPGSTDGSREIIEKYRDRITTIIFEPDQGPPDGLNKGFALATGDIFGYLNSDDVYLPRTLEKVAKSFQRYANAKVIYGHGYIVDPSGRVKRRFYSDRFTPWRFVHGGAVVMQQSTFFQKDAFRAVNGFNSSNPIWWDAELLLDFAMLGMKMQVVNDFWSVFTIHEHSISGQKGKDSDRSRKVDSDRKKTHERLYRKVTGHDPDAWTPFFMLIARIKKWMMQPVGTIWRVFEKLGLRIGMR